MKHKRAYHYRCYPTPEQHQILARTFGCARFAYNWALRLRTDVYYQRQERVSYSDTSAAMTTLKKQPEYAWLATKVPASPRNKPCATWTEPSGTFLRGGPSTPTFKKKHGRQSAEYTTSAFRWDGTELTLAKMSEPLPIRWSRPLPKDAKPTTITVSKDTAGRYFVSFLVEEDFQPLPVPPQMVGIDLGLHDTVTLSTGEKVGNEKFLTQDEARLK